MRCKIKYDIPESVKLTIEDSHALRKDRQDSAFYTWGDPYLVATLEFQDNTYTIECVGEMRIEYDEYSIRNTEDLFEAGIDNDKKLSEIAEKGGEWINNSWFEVFDHQRNEYTGEIYHEVKEAVEIVANWIIDKEAVNA